MLELLFGKAELWGFIVGWLLLVAGVILVISDLVDNQFDKENK